MISSVLLNKKLADDVKKEITFQKVELLYALAKPQDLSHILHLSLCQNNLSQFEGEYAQSLQKQEIIALYRYETMKYESQRVYKLLYENGICFVPLKGAFIRKFYPKEYMRTSCDVDVFIQERDLERATKIVTSELAYEYAGRGNHDAGFWNKKRDFYLEMHFSLIMGELDKADRLLENAWDYVIVEGDVSNGAKLSNEFLLMYIVAHAAKHFMYGGCGVRPFMDIYLLRKNLDFSNELLEALLEKAGLTLFAKCAFELSEAWFGNGVHTDVSRDMQDYIFQSGVYGSQENFVAMRKAQNKGVFSRLFLPLRYMKQYYPVLNKAPVLLPYYWCVRCVKVLTSGRTKRTVIELQTGKNMTKEKIESIKNLCSKLGM